MELEELKKSREKIGEIFPVLKDQNGNILDGFHRKRINPNWKEEIIQVKDEEQALLIRAHANDMRREVDRKEKEDWVTKARELIKKKGGKGAQKEISAFLGFSREWVRDYDPIEHQKHDTDSEDKSGESRHFFGYNVWGFKDNSWRNLIEEADPLQPDVEFYHGATPAFVIHQLIRMFEPKKVLDNMAGTGTVGYVCSQYKEIKCDLFDLNPFPKWNVQEGDAENTPKEGKYDLIFNHLPYLNMVEYSKTEGDMSRMKEEEFYKKLKKIFSHNYKILADDGYYAILIGDWRHQKKIVPLTAQVTMLALECGFVLQDEAIKLTAEQKSTGIQEYRAAKSGYLAQTFDTVLIFKKVE